MNRDRRFPRGRILRTLWGPSMYCESCRTVIDRLRGTCPRCGAEAEPGATKEASPSLQQPLADSQRRLVAGLVDLLPIVGLAFAAMALRLKFGVGTRSILMGAFVPSLGLLLARDALRGLSPGKLLMGLRTVRRSTGAPTTMPDSVLRNLPLIPIAIAPMSLKYGPILAGVIVLVHGLLVFGTGRGLTDRLGGTNVVRRT